MIDLTQVANTFVANLPLLITAITGLIGLWKKVEAVHVEMNSMKDALVAAEKAKSHAEGMADQKVRQGGKDAMIAAAVEQGRTAAIAEQAALTQAHADGAAEKRDASGR